MRNITAAYGASTALALASPALAGIVTGAPVVGQMAVGVGFANGLAPNPFDDLDRALINSPPSGSALVLGGSIPGSGSFATSLSFTESVGDTAFFSFLTDVAATPFGGGDLDFAMSIAGVSFETETPLLITLVGMISGANGGSGWLSMGPSGFLSFAPSTEPILLQFQLDPGTYRIAWGAVVNRLGGSAEFEGTLTLTSVPAPGSAALLFAAGLLTGVRRRRG